MAKKVGRLLVERMLANRSPLYRWLRENRDEIAPILAIKPVWQVVAKTAADSGVRMPKDAMPSRQAVRKAWMRLEQDMEAESKIKVRKARTAPEVSLIDATPPVVSAPTPKPPEKSSPPNSPETGFDESRRTRFTFKPVTPKGSYSREE
jgi:hypothetical protein